MRLDYFYIKGFRRISETKIICGDATFLIGENNVGKSSVLKALEIYFSETNKLADEEFFKIDEQGFQVSEIILEGKLVGLPDDANEWRGFKGRIHKETINGTQTNCIYYRKIFTKGAANSKREMKCFKKTIAPHYSDCKTLDDYINKGVSAELISDIFQNVSRDKTIPSKEKDKLELIPDIWEVEAGQSEWDSNPGGIEGNILIRLPKFLLIPAENKKEEIDGSGGTLQKTMKELFEDVRDVSDNYKQAQYYLDLLAAELDPKDENKEFGRMIKDINQIISGVFTNTKLHIETDLSDPGASIKPSFGIEMSSNVRTKPERQGMGSIRSTVFALLRYREVFVQRKLSEGQAIRPIIIGFEEPEMFLHPNAASLMRDKIYELAISSNSKIICSTHSPYMIDLSKKIDKADYPKQVLNLFKLERDATLNCETCKSIAFNTSEAYLNLQDKDKDFIKFILKIDDYVAKVFFCKKVIIVEGDTEEVLLKETINRLPVEKRKQFLSNYQIIRARGKATIISLIKYLKALSITPFVIHDQDTEKEAVKFNAPILATLDNDEDNRYMVVNTIEDLLGYTEPKNEKPFKAYKHISENWGENWNDIPEVWRNVFETKIACELFQE